MHRVIVSTILFLLVFSSPAIADTGQENEPSKFILIHLDAAASHYMKSEIEAGNLPNIEKTFSSHGYIEKAITYFPSKTPNVIASLRDGKRSSESDLLNWSFMNTDTGRFINKSSTFLRMVWSKQRIARTNIIHGTPVFDRMAGIALQNVPDLIDDYRVLEFYWYAVDSYGHFYGEEDYLRKLAVFDKHFGKMMNRIDDDVNIIIYADHGMTFGKGVETDENIETLLGDQARSVSYPNLYIRDYWKIDDIAREVLNETEIDFTFYSLDDNSIKGFHEQGTLYFYREGNKLRYRFEGQDPFGYYERGYDGEPMTKSEWIQFSYDMEYPAVPISVLNLMLNPRSGDILTLMGPSKYNQTSYARAGNHGGITYRDLTIPLLFRGPELEFLYDRETYWLPDLFLEVDPVEFHNTPVRDEHYINSWFSFSENKNMYQLSLSIRYRWALGGEITYLDGQFPARLQSWTKLDVFRGYIARVWLGAGIEYENGETSPMGFIRHELRYRSLKARTTLSTTRDHQFALELRLVDPLSVQVVNFNSAGFRVHF